MSKGDNEGMGYGKPPRANRFPKGKSGNPAGRPRGARNKTPSTDRVDAILLDEILRQIDVSENGKKKVMPTIRAIARAVNVNAIKGDARAQRLALDVASRAEEKRDEQRKLNYQVAWDYVELSRQQIAEAKARGQPRPTFEIDPDDVQFNPETMEATYNDRSPTDEKGIITLLNYRYALVEEATLFADELKTELEPEMLTSTIDQLHWALEMLNIVESKLQGPFLKIGDGSYDFADIEVFRSKKSSKTK